jgi:hypothetical protein
LFNELHPSKNITPAKVRVNTAALNDLFHNGNQYFLIKSKEEIEDKDSTLIANVYTFLNAEARHLFIGDKKGYVFGQYNLLNPLNTLEITGEIMFAYSSSDNEVVDISFGSKIACINIDSIDSIYVIDEFLYNTCKYYAEVYERLQKEISAKIININSLAVNTNCVEIIKTEQDENPN